VALGGLLGHSAFNLLHSQCKGGAWIFIIHHSPFCIPWLPADFRLWTLDIGLWASQGGSPAVAPP
jgi:hypothetical protein